MGIRARVFNIMQYEVHPTTGEKLIDEKKIKEGLDHKTIGRWAYICHDKDKYTKEDEEKNKEHKEGTLKPKHWHIVIETPKSAREVEMIAKWFGVPENFVEIPKGKGAFLDCVEYLTHEREEEQKKGKTLYDDKCVKANFKFRKEIAEREERRIRYGRDLNDTQKMFFDVLYQGKTLRECEDDDKFIYMENLDKLKKLRIDYMQKRAEMPKFRINYYIDGKGGIGKNLASKALAKSLYPDMCEDDLYFEVGGQNVSLEGYDGQPVIIWNDRRAVEFIATFGRGETFDIFDSHPTNARHNIKYGSVRLVNAVNIVNGVESYAEFLDGLAGEYMTRDGFQQKAEDKGQSKRRFPIILCLREDEFDVLLNKGIALGTREYDAYVGYEHIRGSFYKVGERLDGMARDKVLINMMQPALSATHTVKEKEKNKISEVEEIPEEFKDYGKVTLWNIKE